MAGYENQKGAVRCKALTLTGLSAMERHGKRRDRSSQLRRIRDEAPLVYRTLDLDSACSAHMKGAQMNRRTAKPVLHFIIRFPPGLLQGGGLPGFTGEKRDRQQAMLDQAVRFVNDTHGGNAVFAGRLDCDEEGETIVDIFAVPRYEKRTRRTPPDRAGKIWVSPTRFGKLLALKHEAEIHRRHPEARAKVLTSPRMVGIALQNEFAEFFEMVTGMALTPKCEKTGFEPDRLEKEQHERLARQSAELDRQRAELAEFEGRIAERDAALAQREQALRAAEDAAAQTRTALEARIAAAEQQQVTTDRLRVEARNLEARIEQLQENRKSLEADASQVGEAVELLRPAVEAARRIDAAAQLSDQRIAEAWSQFTAIPYVVIEEKKAEHQRAMLRMWALAVRLADPWFAIEAGLPVHSNPRKTFKQLMNLDTEAGQKMSAYCTEEPGEFEAMRALAAGRVHRVQDGSIRVEYSDPAKRGLAESWLMDAWAGKCRGAALANGAALKDMGLASFIGTLPSKTQQALSSGEFSLEFSAPDQPDILLSGSLEPSEDAFECAA